MKYITLVETYEKLESTTKRLNKTYYISELLKKTPAEDMDKIALLLQGKLFPSWDESKIGMAARLVLKAINIATGIDSNKIEQEWKKTGDLGLVAENTTKKKKQATLFSSELTVLKVFNNLKKLATLEGAGTVDKKIKLVAELLTSAKPLEAKYIIRTILEDLRVGIGEGSIRDAIAWAYFPAVKGIFCFCKECKKFVPKTAKCLSCGKKLDLKAEAKVKNVLEVKDVNEIKKPEDYKLIVTPDDKTAREVYNFLTNKVQEAIDVTNDFALVAKTAKEKGLAGLSKISLKVGTPIKVMLFIKAKDMEDAFKRVGEPAAFEYKYDGFRLQIHKDKKITLYTRRLEDVTKQFPEVVSYVKEHVKGKTFILDAEAVGFNPKTKKYLPFQSMSQRIKRKYNIEQMAKDFPVELNVFDIVYLDGKSLLKKEFKERRRLIEKIVKPSKHKIVLAKQIITSDKKKAEVFYQDSLKAGEEGVMAKKLDAPYKPGARVGYGVKIKPVMEALDLVIIEAEWGEGKRANWLSSFTVACQDEDGNLLEIGKVSTGLKEKREEGLSFEEMTELLKPLIKKEKGKTVTVKPKIIIEINYEEIQKSPTYTSGYALRFPRVIRLRDEKSIHDINTLSEIEELYFGQRGR